MFGQHRRTGCAMSEEELINAIATAYYQETGTFEPVWELHELMQSIEDDEKYNRLLHVWEWVHTLIENAEGNEP